MCVPYNPNNREFQGKDNGRVGRARLNALLLCCPEDEKKLSYMTLIIIQLIAVLGCRILQRANANVTSAPPQSVLSTGRRGSAAYPKHLQRIEYVNRRRDKTLEFLATIKHPPALRVDDLYRQRWQVEPLFKRVKRHLWVRSFHGHSENAVETQVWTAVSVHALMVIIKKRLKNPYAGRQMDGSRKRLILIDDFSGQQWFCRVILRNPRASSL